MDKATSVLAAFEAGKIPSQQQLDQFIDWLRDSVIPDATPSNTGGLSTRGVALASTTRELLAAYRQLGDSKNGDNILQKIIWHSTHADLRSTRTDLTNTMDVDTDDASRDLKAVRSSLSTIFQIIWSSISAEGQPLFADFSSFVRLGLADAAEVIERQAGQAKESLRTVEDEVQSGDRNTIGIKKETQNQPDDAQAVFERNMDRAKEAGSTVIGATQTATAKVEDVSSRATSRVEEAYNKICERALNDEDYRGALNTVFDIAKKWLNRSLDALDTQDPSTLTLGSFVDDPTPEQHATKALNLFSTLLERLAGGKQFSPLFSAMRQCALDIREDPDLKEWFNEFFTYSHRSLNEAGYSSSDEAKRIRKDLNTRWNKMLHGESEGAKRWTRDIERVKKEVATIDEAMKNDKDLERVRKAHARFGTEAVRTAAEAEKAGASMLDQATWFWQDGFKVYLPKFLKMLKDVPIPRTEYKDDEVEFVLENLDISSFDLLPAHTYIRNITDIDINAAPDAETQTKFGSLTHIRIQALQLALNDVSFWYRDKTAVMGPGDISGLLGFKLPTKGIDVDLKMRLIPTDKQEERERRGGRYHVIETVDVHISEDAEISIRDSNHGVLLTLFKPIFTMRVREALEKSLAEQLRLAIEWMDGVSYDIGRRKEIFLDTGLGEGSSLAAAIWSEIGRYRRGERRTAFEPTGTGLVVKEEGKGGKAFAVGVEPQILSGSKRGPEGTGSESLDQKIERMADTINVDVEQAKGKVQSGAGQVKEQAKEAAKEVKDTVQTFQKSVEVKKQREEQSKGWESAAFDL